MKMGQVRERPFNSLGWFIIANIRQFERRYMKYIHIMIYDRRSFICNESSYKYLPEKHLRPQQESNPFHITFIYIFIISTSDHDLPTIYALVYIVYLPRRRRGQGSYSRWGLTFVSGKYLQLLS